MHKDLRNARGVPGPRPHSWCVVELAWPEKPGITPSPGWNLRLCRGSWQTSGLAWPIVSCTPASHWQSSQPSASCLDARPPAAGLKGTGAAPPVLGPHPSMMPHRPGKACSREGRRGQRGLCLGRSCLGSGPLGPGDLPPPPHQLLCGLLGSSPSRLALLPAPRVLPSPLLPAGRGESVPFTPAPPSLPHWPWGLPLCTRPPQGFGLLPSPWPPPPFQLGPPHPHQNPRGLLPAPLCGKLCPPLDCLWVSVGPSVNRGCCGVPGR